MHDRLNGPFDIPGEQDVVVPMADLAGSAPEAAEPYTSPKALQVLAAVATHGGGGPYSETDTSTHS